MLRALVFFAKLAVLVAIAIWLAGWPAKVAVNLPPYDLDLWFVKFAWPGYRIDTSIGILVLAVALVAALFALLYRFWGGIRRAPRNLGRSLQRNRKQRGYRALTQGMVAVAAGEAEEAQRLSHKADVLLDEPPLTLLLAAQAAQLGGDDKAARRYFNAMLTRDETRFLGLRGLINQALRDGDEAAALEHVRAAYRLRPRTPWVLTTLFDLSERRGDFDGAAKALREAAKAKALPAPEADRKRAVVLLEQAMEAHGGHDPALTLKLARRAHKLAPDLVPATRLAAELLTGSGRKRDAAHLLERAWARGPHPDLARAFRKVNPGKDAIAALGEVRKLVNGAPRHPESLLALAEAALEARLWGEARRYLGAAAGSDRGSDQGSDQGAAAGSDQGAGLTERVCHLMASLEEAEHDDAGKAREWLLKAATALPDPLWVCGACGATAVSWSARCGACRDFDSLAWRAPTRVAPAAPLLAPAKAAALTAEPAGVEVLTAGHPEPGPAVKAATNGEPARTPAW